MPLFDLSPLDVAAYLTWRHDVMNAKPDDGDAVDYDTDGADGFDGG